MREILTSNNKMIIRLGSSYFDSVHKVEGVAMAVAQYYTGCDQVCLERVVDGKVEGLWLDVTRVEPAEKQAMQAEPGREQDVVPGSPDEAGDPPGADPGDDPGGYPGGPQRAPAGPSRPGGASGR